MNEIVLNIISCLVTTVILPLITIGGTKLIQLINSKIQNQKSAKLLSDATTVVTNAVRCVFQTYVEALKKEGNFNKDAQLIALNKARELTLDQLSKDSAVYIAENFGDLNEWVNTQIEAVINLLKNK